MPSDDIYKDENSDENIFSWSGNAIWSHLKDKIYDSTITHNNRTSHNNVIFVVILLNKNGNYDYYEKRNLFPILKDNIDNGYI